MPTYSHSQLQTFVTCELRYAYKYVLKYETPQEPSLALFLGSAVHDTLEQLYRQVAARRTPTLESMITIYQAERAKVKGQCVDFAKEDITLHYERGQHYIQRYMQHYAPFDSHIPMEMEKRIHFKLDEEQQIGFAGIIDRLDVRGHDLTIVDYKTNKKRSDDHNDTIRKQVSLYALGLQQHYGTKLNRMFGKIIYLHLENEIEREITQADIQEVQQEYMKTIKQIEHKKERRSSVQGLFADGSSVDDIFPPTESYSCNYCAYKPLCPLFRHQFGEDEAVSGGDLDGMTIKHLVDEYATINAQFKALETQKKMIGNTLTEYAMTQGHKRLYGKEHSVGITARSFRGVEKGKEDMFETMLKEDGALAEVQKINTNSVSSKITKGELDEKRYKEVLVEKKNAWIQGVKKEEGKDVT